MKVFLEFSGGMELLFGGVKSAEVQVPDDSKIRDLLVVIRDKLLKERPELFMSGSTMYVLF